MSMNLKAVFFASIAALAPLVAWIFITHYYGISGDTRFWCIVLGGLGGGFLTGWAVAQSMAGQKFGTALVLTAGLFDVVAPLSVIIYHAVWPPTATAAASTTSEGEIQAVKLVEPGPGQNVVTAEAAEKGAKLAAAMGLEQRGERPSVSDQFAADLRAKSLLGTWSGSAYREGYGFYPLQMTLHRLVVGADAGTIDYPTLG